MAREKMFDPTFQKSFTEAIHKENKIRVQWYLENASLLRRGVASCAWDDEPDDDDDDFVKREDGKKDMQKRFSPVKSEERKDLEGMEQSLLKELPEQKEVKPSAIMKPVPVPTRRLLYKGLSHHGEGRSNYLRTRYKKSPENKFYFPICSSWEYGWTYGQDQEFKCPQYGRRQIIRTSFFRPNDPQLKPRD